MLANPEVSLLSHHKNTPIFVRHTANASVQLALSVDLDRIFSWFLFTKLATHKNNKHLVIYGQLSIASSEITRRELRIQQSNRTCAMTLRLMYFSLSSFTPSYIVAFQERPTTSRMLAVTEAILGRESKREKNLNIHHNSSSRAHTAASDIIDFKFKCESSSRLSGIPPHQCRTLVSASAGFVSVGALMVFLVQRTT